MHTIFVILALFSYRLLSMELPTHPTTHSLNQMRVPRLQELCLKAITAQLAYDPSKLIDEKTSEPSSRIISAVLDSLPEHFIKNMVPYIAHPLMFDSQNDCFLNTLKGESILLTSSKHCMMSNACGKIYWSKNIPHISASCFSYDEKLVAIKNASTLWIFDTKTGNFSCAIPSASIRDDFCFDLTNRFLYVKNTVLYAVDLAPTSEHYHTICAKNIQALCAFLPASNSVLVSRSSAYQVQRWAVVDAHNGTVKKELPYETWGHTPYLYTTHSSLDNTIEVLAMTTFNTPTIVELHDLTAPAIGAFKKLIYPCTYINAMTILPNGKYILVSSGREKSRLSITDIASEENIAEFTLSIVSPLCYLFWSSERLYMQDTFKKSYIVSLPLLMTLLKKAFTGFIV